MESRWIFILSKAQDFQGNEDGGFLENLISGEMLTNQVALGDVTLNSKFLEAEDWADLRWAAWSLLTDRISDTRTSSTVGSLNAARTSCSRKAMSMAWLRWAMD